jgi:tetratricopeptide (TPR) repeat protein
MAFSLFSEESINKMLQQYLDRGQWSKAAEQYKKLIKLHPDNITFRLRMAETCIKSGNKKEALEQYQIIADHHIGLGNLSKAVTIFRTMLNLDPGLSHIRIQLAELYAKLGDNENMWNQYLTAFKYLEEKKLVAQAVAVLEQIAKLRLDDPKLMIQLAEMFLARNLSPQAISQFLAVAEYFLEKQEFKKAAKYYEKVLKIDAKNKEAKMGLNVLQTLAGQPPQPATPATEKATPSPQATPPKEKTAEEELNALLAETVNQTTISGEDSQSHYNLGKVYQEMALVDAAIDEFVKAANDPNLQHKCYKMLSECFGQKGMTRQAQKYQQMSREQAQVSA